MIDTKKYARKTIEARNAFYFAILQGRLSDNPQVKNFAGNYMYMGKNGQIDLFKNIISRQYDV